MGEFERVGITFYVLHSMAIRAKNGATLGELTFMQSALSILKTNQKQFPE
jgi:hypothetical protein